MEHCCNQGATFELLAEHGCGCHGHHHRPDCDGRHRIYLDHTFKSGDFIYFDTTTKTYKLAVEGHCDFMVLNVDHCNTWIEVASTGIFILRNYVLTGPLYINSLGSITNTETITKVGFIENGIIYLLIERTSSGSTPVGNFIENQQAVEQAANIRISGNIFTGSNNTAGGTSSAILASQQASVESGESVSQSAIIASQSVSLGVDTDGSYQNLIASSQNVQNVHGAGNSIISSKNFSLALIPSVYNNVFLSLTELNNSNTSAILSNSILSGKISIIDVGGVSESFVMVNGLTTSAQIQNTLVLGDNITITNKKGNYLTNSAIFGEAHSVDSRAYGSLISGAGNTAESYYVTISGGDLSLYGEYSYGSVMFGQQNLLGTSDDKGVTGYCSFIGGMWNNITSQFENAFLYTNFIFGQSHIIELTVVSQGLYNNAILGGASGKISGAGYSNGIFAGQSHVIDSVKNMSVGYYDEFIDEYISFTGNALPLGLSVTNNTLLGGSGNSVVGVQNCSVVSGQSNEIGMIVNTTGDSYSPGYNNIVVGGSSNKIYGINLNTANNQSILGGQSNIIISRDTPSYSGGIINGANNTLISDGSNIFGGSHNLISNSTSYNFNTILNGEYCNLTGTYTTLIGRSLVGLYKNQLIIGVANDNKADSVFEIGGGTPIGTENGVSTETPIPKNIFRVNLKGDVEFNTLVFNTLPANPTTIAEGQMFVKTGHLFLKTGGIVYDIPLVSGGGGGGGSLDINLINGEGGSSLVGNSPLTASRATGYASVALGSGTILTGGYSITAGYNNTSESGYSAIFGEANNTINGCNYDLIAGKNNSLNQCSFSTIVGSDNIAVNSHNTIISGSGCSANAAVDGFVTGQGCAISGMGSWAGGYNSTATKLGFAFGQGAICSTVDGFGSAAIGYSVESSSTGAFATGAFTKATGYTSFVCGNTSEATGDNSFAGNDHCIAAGDNSHAEGFFTQSSGENSHAEGDYGIASGLSSHAEGSQTEAIGDYSHAAGYNTTASGETSHSEGYNTQAIGAVSHAEGYGTRAEGNHSHAEGDSCVASGYKSHAEGSNSVASGEGSHAEGDYTTASGKFSKSSGVYTEANGDYSTVSGDHNIAALPYQHVLGEYAIDDTGVDPTSNYKMLKVGGGDWNYENEPPENRKDAFFVRRDGIIGTTAFKTNGTGTPTSLGSTCPATNLVEPYAWIQFELGDGSVVYMPAWK